MAVKILKDEFVDDKNFVRKFKEEAQAAAAAELVEKVFDGSASLLFASLLSKKQLPPEEIHRLRELIDELE